MLHEREIGNKPVFGKGALLDRTVEYREEVARCRRELVRRSKFDALEYGTLARPGIE